MVESHTVIPKMGRVLGESKATAVFFFFFNQFWGETENLYHVVDILHMVGFIFKLLAS